MFVFVIIFKRTKPKRLVNKVMKPSIVTLVCSHVIINCQSEPFSNNEGNRCRRPKIKIKPIERMSIRYFVFYVESLIGSIDDWSYDDISKSKL